MWRYVGLIENLERIGYMFDLEEILEKHKHWINQDCDEWESMRADLQDTGAFIG